MVLDGEPYVPRTFLKSGLSVGRLPAIIPVLHSVLWLLVRARTAGKKMPLTYTTQIVRFV